MDNLHPGFKAQVDLGIDLEGSNRSGPVSMWNERPACGVNVMGFPGTPLYIYNHCWYWLIRGLSHPVTWASQAHREVAFNNHGWIF